MRSMLTPDEWHQQVIDASGGTQIAESGQLSESSDAVQRAKDLFEFNIPVDGSFAAAALATANRAIAQQPQRMPINTPR